MLPRLYIPFYSITLYSADLLRISAHSLSLYLRMFINNGSSLLRPESIIQMRTVVSGVVSYRNININNNASSVLSLEFGIAWNWQTLNDNHRFLFYDGTVQRYPIKLNTHKSDDGAFHAVLNGFIPMYHICWNEINFCYFQCFISKLIIQRRNSIIT
ncbi:unnamed protein product [Rotaria sp. Silwood2]|nr:unnamed protein product [Rotaria sp. Silwood2]